MGDMKSKVAIIECREYENAKRAIAKAVELLGGWSQFVQPDESIILKPNLLTKAKPEQACTTHPAVFGAVGGLMKEAGYSNLFYGDSPGPGLGNAESTARDCGIKAEADALGIPMADFDNGSKVEFPEGRTAKEFFICEGIQEKDAIINICKMKTHQLERITGAVKNIFGAVCGFNKGAAHAIYPSADVFAKMLADLNRLVKPRLHIMDGVLAMEGNGPQSGDPIKMNVIIASADPVAVDSVFCRLVHLNPELVFTNIHGQNYGVGTWQEDNIEVLTEDGAVSIAEAVEKWGNPEFNVPRGNNFSGTLPFVGSLIKLLDRKPVVKKDICISCGVCIEACPLDDKAICFKNGKPAYNYRKCIKCYCCQEMCPKKAIDVKDTIVSKIANRNWKL
jgi:uncharacterized protein (DUF362 family)/Pyruvate/2-oxoacid:ferredoxin oxidoreductase delta subunit